MTQEAIKTLRSTADTGPSHTHAALERVFPEYSTVRKGKHKAEGPLQSSARDNTPDLDTPRTFRSRKPIATPSITCNEYLQPFDVPSLLLVPNLKELATLVVDSEARKEERRRRRRVRDGQARLHDLELERDRRVRGIDPKEWRLSGIERQGKRERLVEWVIRNVAEEGCLVQVKLNVKNREYGYLPLPPQLLLPLLIPHLEAEKLARQMMFMRKSDPRRGSGMTVAELVARLRAWGEEGRWERVGEWKVEEALKWGEERGMVERVVSGWWTVDSEG